VRKLIQKGINMAIAEGIIKPVTPKSKPKTVNTLVPKSKPVKYASIGRKQMAMGRSGTVVTSGGLLTNKNMKIKEKKLLGE
jgi:hypothetical protein